MISQKRLWCKNLAFRRSLNHERSRIKISAPLHLRNMDYKLQYRQLGIMTQAIVEATHPNLLLDSTLRKCFENTLYNNSPFKNLTVNITVPHLNFLLCRGC